MKEFSPYEEANLVYDKREELLSITLPWISGRMSTAHLHREKLNTNKPESIFEALLEQAGKEECYRLPFLYIHPESTKLDMGCRPEHFCPDDLEQQMRNAGISTSDFLLAAPVPWNEEQVAGMARIGEDVYDPLTVYTAVRRLRNLHANTTDDAPVLLGKLLNELRTGNPGKFYACIARLLMQSYYVTSHSTESLEPAVAVMDEAAEKMQQYILEEKGHHHLIYKSLRALDYEDVSAYRYFGETRASMILLRFAAARHPVAFCCMLGAFENAANYNSDPIADMLTASGRADAAGGLIQHFQINKQGDHAEIGLELAAILKPCDRSAVKSAVYYSSMLQRLFGGMARQLLREFKVHSS